jgi:hypothetical protein
MKRTSGSCDCVEPEASGTIADGIYRGILSHISAPPGIERGNAVPSGETFRDHEAKHADLDSSLERTSSPLSTGGGVRNWVKSFSISWQKGETQEFIYHGISRHLLSIMTIEIPFLASFPSLTMTQFIFLSEKTIYRSLDKLFCVDSRFASVGNYSSYCRCVKADWKSNGKVKGKGNRKNGNSYLAWAYVEAANFARRYCPEAHAYFERKKARTNSIVATKALANKLCKACYFIMKNQEDF